MARTLLLPNNFLEIRKARGLAEGKKAPIVKEMAKATPPPTHKKYIYIARFIDRHVDNVKCCFLVNPLQSKTQPDSGILKTVSIRNLRNVKRQLFKKTGQTSKIIIDKVNLRKVSNSTKCRLLRDTGKSVTLEDRPTS